MRWATRPGVHIDRAACDGLSMPLGDDEVLPTASTSTTAVPCCSTGHPPEGTP